MPFADALNGDVVPLTASANHGVSVFQICAKHS